MGTIMCPINMSNTTKKMIFSSMGVDKFANVGVHENHSIEGLRMVRK